MLKIQSKGKSTISLQNGSASLLLFPEGKQKPKEGEYLLLAESQENDESGVISWPGEYDYSGVAIRGVGHDSWKSVSYIVTIDGMRCGVLASPLEEWNDEDIELLGDLDILMVPAEDAKKVQKIIDEVDPRVVIPLKTNDKTWSEVVSACGGKGAEEVKDVKIKKSTLPTESREVYVLSS